MRGRAHIATLFAIAVILASLVNLVVVYSITSRPRAIIRETVERAKEEKLPLVMPRPAISIEEAVRKDDVVSVKQHMYWCLKDGNCDLDRELRLAAESADPTIAKVLIAAGAKVNASDHDKETPLHSAASVGRTGTVQVLLAAGADVNARDDEGRTPLHSAAAWGHVELARMLLAAGANANAADATQHTPLHLVASRRVPPLSGYAALARLLLSSGARPNARAADGSTPLHLAEISASRLSLEGNLKATGDANEVVALLRERGGHE